MDKPLISIITINYNGLEHTLGLLASLQKIRYPNIEVIVVDNASKEDPAKITANFPDTVLLKNPVNEGFAGGNNRGMEIAHGDFFFLINNDTELCPNILDVLLERANSRPNIGLVCPKILYHEKPNIIQYAGFSAINRITGRGKGVGYGEEDNGQYQTPSPTHLAHGAAMFIPRKVVEDIGMMAEQYFLYYEEMDYCQRIKKAGYEIWYEPDTFVLHKESMSVGKGSLLKTYYMSRNRWLYLRRNVEWPWFLFTTIYYVCIAVPKNLLTHISKSEWDHFKSYLRGFWNSLFVKNPHDNPSIKHK
jgi:GT2 family glycosyltransferase